MSSRLPDNDIRCEVNASARKSRLHIECRCPATDYSQSDEPVIPQGLQDVVDPGNFVGGGSLRNWSLLRPHHRDASNFKSRRLNGVRKRRGSRYSERLGDRHRTVHRGEGIDLPKVDRPITNRKSARSRGQNLRGGFIMYAHV